MIRLDALSWDAEKRAVFFRPWWRALISIGLAVPAIVLTPTFARDPAMASWLGPVSVLPMLVWLALGFRQIHSRRRPEIDR